jgi:hypothetical protein
LDDTSNNAITSSPGQSGQQLQQGGGSGTIRIEEESAKAPPLKKFRLLSQDTCNQALANVRAGASSSDVLMEMERYEAEQKSVATDSALEFWLSRVHSYPKLALLAEDVISAPASQAYVERVFSLCGDLCARKRNRMCQSLECRVFLKMNYALMH